MRTAFHEHFSYPEEIRLRATRLESFDFLAHWHEDIELAIITSGRQRVGVNHQLLTLSAGQVVLVAPSDIHYYSRIEETSGYLMIFPAEILERSLLDHSTIWSIGSPAKLARLTGLADQLVQEMKACGPHVNLAAEGLLKLLLANLLRPDPGDNRLSLDKVNHPKFLVMQEILSFIEEKRHEPICRDDLAARFHVSVSHFTRLFKAASGLCFTDYLARLRLEDVCRQISRTDMPIGEIALENGFSSIRTFNRMFQKVLQRTPSSFRSA